MTTLLCLISSVLFRGDGQPVNVWVDPFFLISFGVTIYVFFAIFVMMNLHYCYWQSHVYTKQETGGHQAKSA